MTKLIYYNPVSEDYDLKDFFKKMKSINETYLVLNETIEDSTRYVYMIKGVAVDFRYFNKTNPTIRVRLYGLNDYSKVEKLILGLLPQEVQI